MTPTREEIAATYDIDKERKTTTRQVWSNTAYVDGYSVENVIKSIERLKKDLKEKHNLCDHAKFLVSVAESELSLYSEKQTQQTDAQVIDSIFVRLQIEETERQLYLRLKKKSEGKQ